MTVCCSNLVSSLCEDFNYEIEEELDGFGFSLIKSDGTYKDVQTVTLGNFGGSHTVETHATTGPVDMAMRLDHGKCNSTCTM